VSAIVYVGVFLEKESRDKLLKLVPPRHPTIYAEHVTVCFKPSLQQLANFKLGERIEFQAMGVVFDARGQAVRVRGVPSENEHPHITISCALATKPVYSNQLLKQGRVDFFDDPIDLVGIMDSFPRTTEVNNG
jgi:hypothetical protein